VKFDFNIIKERKKEIIIVSIYLVLFFAIILGINHFDAKKTDKQFEEDLAKIQYNTILNSNFSETELLADLKKVTMESENLKQKLPIDLEYRNVNQKLTEIINVNNIFSLSSCTLKEIETKEGYSAYQVRVNEVNGTYAQFKNFIKYIGEYDSKVVITQLDIDVVDITNIQGTMTLVFYGIDNAEV